MQGTVPATVIVASTVALFGFVVWHDYVKPHEDDSRGRPDMLPFNGGGHGR